MLHPLGQLPLHLEERSSIFLRRMIGVMFMRVNLKCAHQLRPPRGGIQWKRPLAKPFTTDQTYRFGRTVVLSEAAASAANAEEPRVGRPHPRRNDSAERLMVYAENQIPSQINSSRLASDSQTAGGRQQQASLARDEHGWRHV
jgi:hypothetical protein